MINNINYHHQTDAEIEWLVSRDYWTPNHTLINKFLTQHVPGSHVIAYVYDKYNEDVVIFAKKLDKIEFFSGNSAIIIAGENNRCHSNCDILLENKRIKKKYSGYAM